MKKWLSDRKNLILVILVAVAIVCLALSSITDALMALSCIMLGVVCIYSVFLLYLRYIKLKRSKVKDFIPEGEEAKKKKVSFLESENKINTILSFILFLMMGVMLIYFGFKMF